MDDTPSLYQAFLKQERAAAGTCTVSGLCWCRRWQGIDSMFFCTPCSKLRCNMCCQRSIDVYTCASCSSSVSSLSAFRGDLSCSRCMTCPLCDVILILQEFNNGYVYCCGFCKWSSAYSGIVGSSVKELMSNLLWLQNDASNGPRQLISKRIKDICSRTSKSYHDFLSNLDDFDFQAQYSSPASQTKCHPCRDEGDVRPSISMLEKRMEEKATELRTLPDVDLCNEEVQPRCALLFKVWTKHISHLSLTSVEQRRGMLLQDPQLVSALIPRRKRLAAKTAMRCNECMTFLAKPNNQPLSAEFQVLCTAREVLPTPSVVCRRVDPDGKVRVLLAFCNRQHMSAILTVSACASGAEGLVEVSLPIIDSVPLNAFDPILENRANMFAWRAEMPPCDVDRQVVELPSSNAFGAVVTFRSRSNVPCDLSQLTFSLDIDVSFPEAMETEVHHAQAKICISIS